MKWFSSKLPFLILVACFLMSLQAQDITKGSVAGVVRDATGAVIPNVTVTLNTPTGDRTTTTNGSGEYTFLALTPGTNYVVSVSAPGFSTSRTPLTVSINQRTTTDISLQIGTAVQTVDVSAGATEAIDLNSTTVGATLDESLYKNVPVGRNVSAVIALAPGVSDSGGAGAANPSINGASGLENEYIINGANVTDPAYGGFGTYSRVFGPLGNGVNFDFIQEVQVKSGGFEAEYGQALGGVINVVTKSGTNRYHGSLYGYFSPKALSAERPDLNKVLTNVVTYNRNLSSIDVGADLGGFIFKDRLFWYAGFNPRQDYTYESAAAGFANTALGVVRLRTTTYNYVAKLNWNISSKHQLEGSLFGDPATTPIQFNRGLNTTRTGPIDALTTSALDYGSRTWTGRYNGALTNNWVLSVNYSNFYNKLDEAPQANGYRISNTVPGQEKTGTNFSYGGLGFRENSEAKVNQWAANSSNIVHLFGSHTFQYGYQFQNDGYDDFRLNTGADFQIPNLPEFKFAAGLTQHGAALTRTHLNTKDPNSPIVLRVTRGDYSSPTVATNSRYHAGFVEDSWTIGNRLTIKPGLRFEQQSMQGNAEKYVFAHNWAPRIGVIYDPTGSRKSKVFANWGRFFEKIPLDIAIREFSFETSVIGALYKDPGVGVAPDLSPANYIPGGKISFQGSPTDLTFVAGGTKAQYQNEIVGGYEREFGGGLTFQGRFVYRHIRRILEDVSGVNVTQANAGVTQQYVVANPNAKLDIFHNAFPCTSGPTCDTSSGFTNLGDNPLGADGVPDGFPNPSRIYKAMQITVSKRFSSNVQLFANYTLSKLYGNFQGSFRSDNGQTDPNISSLFDFTNSDGLLTDQVSAGVLPTDRTHQLKLFGNYTLRGFNVGVGWNIQSGTPISELADHPVYLNAGEIPVGGRGKLGRTEWIYPLSLHGDYTYKIGENMRVKFVADLFNVTNQSKAFSVIQSSEINNTPGVPNPDFLKPAFYQSPFNARLALRFEF